MQHSSAIKLESVGEDLGRVKGAAFRQFLIWCQSRKDTFDVADAGSRVDPEIAKGLLRPERPALGVLSSMWYPAPVVHQVIDNLVGSLSEKEQEVLAFQASREIVHNTFNSAYRAFIWMFGSPDRYAKMAQRFWDMHYDTGEMAVLDQEKHSHRCRVRNWPGHHAFLCKLNFAAVAPIYEFMGCKDVMFEIVSCVSRGDPECINKASWR